MELHETRIGLQALDAVVRAAHSLEAIAESLKAANKADRQCVTINIPRNQVESIIDSLEDAAAECDANSDAFRKGSTGWQSWKDDVRNLNLLSRALREASDGTDGERIAETKETTE